MKNLKMITQCNDIIFKISEYLTNKEKIYLSMTNKMIDALKRKFMYYDKIHLTKIINLPFFDNFKSVEISGASKLPKNVKHVYFLARFNDTPSSVTHLTFLNGTIDKYYIPPSVMYLTFGSDFDQAIKDIPESITHLTFGTRFDSSIKYIPASVTHLTFGYCFNQSIEAIRTSSVKHLIFNHRFDQPIKNNIPLTATHIMFGNSFNQSIEDAIPPSVTHLIFSQKFNQPINKYIKSITHLIFGSQFNLPINGCIPPTVTHLIFGNNFDQEICDLPASVIYLALSANYKRPINVGPSTKIMIYNVLTYPTEHYFTYHPCYDYLYE